jgi:hypothetical protein
MKKVLLILIMLVLPWQAIAAAERNLTHVLGSGSGHEPKFVIKHIAEHADHVLHHHDDDEDEDANDSTTHIDSSQKSFQHLADFEQGCSMNMLLPALHEPGLPVVERIAPAFRPDVFSDRTTIPLLRPPRALV